MAIHTNYMNFPGAFRGGSRLTQRPPLVHRCAASAKASVNLEVNPGRCSGASLGAHLRKLRFRRHPHINGIAKRNGEIITWPKEPGQHRRRDSGAAQCQSLINISRAKPVGPTLECCVGSGHGTVAITIRLDYHESFGSRGRATDCLDVVRDGLWPN
jgi:hypothetical protein